MAVIKYIAPIAAAAALATAQSSSCSVSGTTTITNAQQATGLAACRTFTGTIAIASSASGDLALDGIEKIEGSLWAENVTQLTGFSGDSLSTITDTFYMNEMTRLFSLTFPRLSSVKIVDWAALQALSGLTFASGIEMADTVNIQNTFLSSLDGINLQMVDTMILANNRLLQKVSMQLGNVSNSLQISSNGRNVSAEFPNLIWAQNMTINNVSSLSVPSLSSVNGSFGMNFNYFDKFEASNLTEVGGTLSLVSNPDLTSISFPVLKTVNGGVQVANNTALKEIDGFPKLSYVGGAVDCYGSFESADFPAINNVAGAFNLQSTADINSTCNKYSSMVGADNTIKGKFTCSTTSHPNSGGTDGSSTTSSGDGSASSSGAANAVVITGATGLLGVVAAIFGLL